MYLYMYITHVKDKLLIEKIHRRFTRMIPELKHVPYGDRLTKYQKIRADLIEVYKTVHGLSSMKLETFFEEDNAVWQQNSWT